MCELIFRTFSRENRNDVHKDRMLYKRGMAICVQDDGWKWSDTEKGPGYTIKRFKGIPKDHETILEMLAPEEGEIIDPESGEKETLRRRLWALDIDAWTVADDVYITDEKISIQDRVARLVAKREDLSTLNAG